MDRHAQAGGARFLDHWHDLAGVVPAAARTRAGDVDADDSTRRRADRLLHDDRVLLGGERPVHHQDQAGADLRVLQARAVEAADRGEDDVVEIALATAVSLHRVEAELERRDPLRAVRAADSGVHRPLDGDRARLDQLRPVVDLVERVEVRDTARIGDRDEAVELPEVLHRERDALLVREAPEDVRGNRPAEVGVQFGESFHEESLERAALLLTYDARVRVWSMQSRGRVSVGFLQSNAATNLPLLRYGRSWTWQGIRCTSRRMALNCKNQSGHGFALSRQSQRVF